MLWQARQDAPPSGAVRPPVRGRSSTVRARSSTPVPPAVHDGVRVVHRRPPSAPSYRTHVRFLEGRAQRSLPRLARAPPGASRTRASWPGRQSSSRVLTKPRARGETASCPWATVACDPAPSGATCRPRAVAGAQRAWRFWPRPRARRPGSGARTSRPRPRRPRSGRRFTAAGASPRSASRTAHAATRHSEARTERRAPQQRRSWRGGWPSRGHPSVASHP